MRICGWPGGLICHFIAHTKGAADQEEWSVLAWGREENKKSEAFEGSLPINQIDRHGNQRSV